MRKRGKNEIEKRPIIQKENQRKRKTKTSESMKHEIENEYNIDHGCGVLTKLILN